MKNIHFNCLLALIIFFTPRLGSLAFGEEPVSQTTDSQPATTLDAPLEEPSSEDGHSVIHHVLLYLPNRVLDILDIFRLRVRVGPGVAVGIRATKVAQAYLGSYVSLYAGLPGPRMRRIPKSPIGLESKSGADISVLEGSTGAGMGPDYSPTEVGAGAQLAVVGVDVGVDPYEVLDFMAGIFTFDLREDDF